MKQPYAFEKTALGLLSERNPKPASIDGAQGTTFSKARWFSSGTQGPHMSNLVLHPNSEQPGSTFDESEVVEVLLLLPRWQMTALEDAAHARGLTAAFMVRQLLNEFIDTLPPCAD